MDKPPVIYIGFLLQFETKIIYTTYLHTEKFDFALNIKEFFPLALLKTNEHSKSHKEKSPS